MEINPECQESIFVTPAAPERWEDIQAIFQGSACWCQYWRMSAGEYGRGTKEEMPARAALRREALREQVQGPNPPGILAYLDGQVCGWCGIGLRTGMQRLVRSKTIPAVDDLAVWTVVCFLVLPGFRRKGVARALLRGAVDCADAHGATAVEAYPVDTGGGRIDSTFAYVGTVSLFEEAGFVKVLETGARSAGLRRWVMRLDLRRR